MYELETVSVSNDIEVDVMLLDNRVQVTLYTSDEDDGVDVNVTLDELVKEVITHASSKDAEVIANGLAEAAKEIFCNIQ